MFLEKPLKLCANDIYEMEFNVEPKGYDAQQVDRFLDLILKDYNAFEKNISTLQSDFIALKMELEETKKKLEEKNNDYEIILQQKKDLEEKGLRNADIINRLSKLESQINK